MKPEGKRKFVGGKPLSQKVKCCLTCYHYHPEDRTCRNPRFVPNIPIYIGDLLDKNPGHEEDVGSGCASVIDAYNNWRQRQ